MVKPELREPQSESPPASRGWARTLAIAATAIAALAIGAPLACAASYTVTDLGASEKAPFEGTAVSLSASGNQVATSCGLWNDGALSTYSSETCGNAGPFNAVNTSGVLVGPENSVVEAFSYSFAEGKPDFFLKAPLANEHPEVVNPVDAAYSIDDAGEIGGFVSSNPRPGPPKDYGFIFDPAEPSGKQVTLIPESLQVLGLWPRWAEVQRSGDVAVLDRSNGVLTTTNLESGDQPPDPFPGNGIASDGTLAGNIVTPGGTPVVSPTLRYSDGSELTLEIPGFAVGDAEDVNESHYAVGNVQLEGHRVEAALWTPTGHLELLKELIPSGSGWVLRNAIAIANDGVIAGTGELEGKEHSFLLTVGSTLPTATGVSCAPASLAPGTATSCTFTVADETPGASQTPTGTVTATSSEAGAWSPAASCTLVVGATPGRAACSLSYTPSAAGSPTLTGTYSGDGEHGSSHGSTSITVSGISTSTGGPSSSSSSGGAGSSGGTGSGAPASGGAAHPSVSGTSASTVVSCTGVAGTSCTVTLTLSVLETLSGHQVTGVAAAASGKRTKRSIVVGSKTVTLAAGSSEPVTVTLNAAGKKLLASHRRLPVKLLASQGSAGRAAFTLLFVQAAKHHKG
jgi:uncharacterized membrane protein YgcG